MHRGFSLRRASQTDAMFLGDMLVEAANWRAGGVRPRHEVLTSTEHRRYLAGWKRMSDDGLVALGDDDVAVGAAWYRVLPQNEPGFGFIGIAVPELIIGVHPLWRARGVGRSLLRGIVQLAGSQGHARISLSVERDNFARNLYRAEGFAVVGQGSTRDTMARGTG
ncbi:GNAT family N-acetyltransferase [Microbacterium oxydans]|uniref:GNAT family N-acetyltransferase n=1 Tax=Microbacterium TaxID=33882 RepID=UPI00073502AA|nr:MULTISPECIES: GNAT family N-acetyltransferase [Microbacterium]KTR78977.1 histone acetyltransferase [Microbacterium oxydans]MBE7954293.1 GNAT family N-acetyltransferase [Microbacterium sp. R1]MCB8044689.1 GNAT family N-acetyltransferase [Microbacterium oxydans]